MLTRKQVKEIKEHLSKAQNPLFFFDNDQDGLCSFLLFQRYIGRGKGVSVKSFPDLSAEYFRKVHELKADYIFILDKPVVSNEFFLEAEKVNIPVVWIDHHIMEKNKQNSVPNFVNYYNPTQNRKKTDEPVTALCYQVTNKQDDLWIAVAGCISDRHIPSFYKKFEKKYPDLAIKSKEAADVFYKSQIGKITKILGFGLKDSTSNVVSMIRFLLKVKNPDEILEENSKNYAMHHRFEQVESKYQKTLKKAIFVGENNPGKSLFFQYGGDLSMSGDLSNELIYTFTEKIIVVIYMKGAKANISVRGKKARTVFLKAIEDLEGATGGGHEVAVGGKMKIEDIKRFRENF